jgi:hypothetical protein
LTARLQGDCDENPSVTTASASYETMTDYTFKHKILGSGDDVSIPDNARDVNVTPELLEDGYRLHVSWLEKHGESVL